MSKKDGAMPVGLGFAGSASLVKGGTWRPAKLGAEHARRHVFAFAETPVEVGQRVEAGGNGDLADAAVGLDQLHQSKLAANYYQRALAATTDRPAGFDPTQLQARLLELQ